MEPARYDITIYQGATFNLPLQYRTGSGVPVNMSGYTVTSQLWNRDGTIKFANFSTPWTNQASGIFNLVLTSTVTSSITEDGQYDVLITEPSGDKAYFLQGTAFIDLGLSGRGA